MTRLSATGLLGALRRTQLNVWYHPDYRPPLGSFALGSSVEVRRSDFVAWYLARQPRIRWRAPTPVSYAKLALVHEQAYLDSLQDPQTLAQIFAVSASDLPASELLHTARLACGGTVEATRFALKTGGVSLNLLGGFHHAAPARGGGFCALNDVAVAVKDARRSGFSGRIGVIDLDAHPPDGTAACLAEDAEVWMASLSGVGWGPLPRVYERVLPPRTTDDAYLRALEQLLAEMPKLELAFVVAGGDVLAGDALGQLALTESGARARDRKVFRALHGLPSVWLPGGGYQPGAWRALAGTALVLLGKSRAAIPRDAQPLREHFLEIARAKSPLPVNAEDVTLSQKDVDGTLFGRPQTPRFLGHYTAEGVEYALQRYGILDQLRRRGFHGFSVELQSDAAGDRVTLLAQVDGKPRALLDCVAQRQHWMDRDVLFINWLSLSDPTATFSAQHPQLPGQELPGLGLAREAQELFVRLAERLKLTALRLHPAWYHIAYGARLEFKFVRPELQGRFEAMLRDFAALPVPEVSRAVAEGRVRMNGQTYQWEPDDMVRWLADPPPVDEARVQVERERAHFEVVR